MLVISRYSITKYLFFIIVLNSLFLSLPSYAWNNHFKFVNNFNYPILLSINPSLSEVSSDCGGNTQDVEVAPRSTSCEFTFTDEKEHWYNLPGHKGTIRLTKKNDLNSFCTYSYSYTYDILKGYFDIHSENFSLLSCEGSFQASEFSVENDLTQFLSKPLAGNPLLNLDHQKSAQVTESLSYADCGGADNCITASPDLNTIYLNHGSTLAQSINLQTQVDQFEPLNFSQFIGTHNSAISRRYTTSKSHFNMSYGDPGNFLSITEQLNAGVRQLELDIEWYHNDLVICHNDVSNDIKEILCDGNSSLSKVIAEIKSWVIHNPNAFLFLYLDVNLPLAGHINDLDNVLSKLDPYVFTPSMVADKLLPFSELSKFDITRKFMKNIIITNDDDVDNLKESQYVFTKVLNSNRAPLPEHGVDAFFAQNYSCQDKINKYTQTQQLFKEENSHFNLWRLNSDRTLINYITSAAHIAPEKYNNYFTLKENTNILACPINIWSTNLLGFTCDSKACQNHPTDPRLFSFLWSWELGFPLQKEGSPLAYLNSITGHFENAPLDFSTNQNNYSVLCIKKKYESRPTEELNWYLNPIIANNNDDLYSVAKSSCQMSGGEFAVPVTSYWLSDVMSLIHLNGQENLNKVLVNYRNISGEWIPNDGLSLVLKN